MSTDNVLEMGIPTYTLVEVEGTSNLTPGTQIAVKRLFVHLHWSLAFLYPVISSDGFYYHHGVYLGEDEVAHFSGEDKADAKPRSCEMVQFMDDAVEEKLYRVDYDNHNLLLPMETTLDEARKAIESPSEWSKYNVITNNCESFATWLKTGIAISAQAGDAVIEVNRLATRLAKDGFNVSIGHQPASASGGVSSGASSTSKEKKQ